MKAAKAAATAAMDCSGGRDCRSGAGKVATAAVAAALTPQMEEGMAVSKAAATAGMATTRAVTAATVAMAATGANGSVCDGGREATVDFFATESG